MALVFNTNLLNKSLVKTTTSQQLSEEDSQLLNAVLSGSNTLVFKGNQVNKANDNLAVNLLNVAYEDMLADNSIKLIQRLRYAVKLEVTPEQLLATGLVIKADENNDIVKTLSACPTGKAHLDRVLKACKVMSEAKTIDEFTNKYEPVEFDASLVVYIYSYENVQYYSVTIIDPYLQGIFSLLGKANKSKFLNTFREPRGVSSLQTLGNGIYNINGVNYIGSALPIYNGVIEGKSYRFNNGYSSVKLTVVGTTISTKIMLKSDELNNTKYSANVVAYDELVNYRANSGVRFTDIFKNIAFYLPLGLQFKGTDIYQAEMFYDAIVEQGLEACIDDPNFNDVVKILSDNNQAQPDKSKPINTYKFSVNK